MAKRPTVEIDEDYLIGMMAGDVPRIKKEQAEKLAEKQDVVKEIEKESTQPIPDTAEQPTAAAKENAPKRRKKDVDYETVFLKKRESSTRRQTYISSALYDKISRYLTVISKISITSYLDNIVSHHLEQYQDDINRLWEENNKKPL